MAVERIKVYEEQKRLSLWLWIIPLLLVAAFVTVFLKRHPSRPLRAVAIAEPTYSTLPDLGVVHFDTNQASLTADGQATLDRAADAMHGNPNVHLRLEGYTDATGPAAHNDTLSRQRAQSVARYLEAKGVEHARLSGGGFGPAKPVDTNATDAGKADNRRVELYVK